MEHVHRTAPERLENEVRAQLARLLVRGRKAEQRIDDLAGGERLRVALASARALGQRRTSTAPSRRATNNLDLPSARELVEPLNAYQGALIMASHDEPFLRDIRAYRNCAHTAIGR